MKGKLMSGRRVGDFADDDVGGGFHFEAVGDEELRFAGWN